MPIEHVPLLKMQRDLHDILRGMERFHAYLKTIVNDEGDDVRYAPLVIMNPMGREHVSARLDELLALDAETIAVQAIDQALQKVDGLQGSYQHGMVIIDDLRGGWTNRTVVDAAFRFDLALPMKRPWLTTGWWVSETPTPEKLMQAVQTTIYRLLYVQEHGRPTTLRQMLQQEGSIAASVGLTPQFDQEELDYSRYVLSPYLDSTEYPVQVAALYGNTAATSLGYQPLGLSDNAGFEVALANALSVGQST
jgi:hypothetical protein